MNFDRYFNLSSYSLLTTSFAMLVATRQLDWISVALFMAMLVTGFLIDTNRLSWNLPRRWANTLMLVYVGMAFVEWQVLRFSPVLVISHFVLFATSMKLLRTKTNRDWLWLHIVSFCLVLMSAGLSAGTTFLLLLVVYIFAAVSTFIGFEIRRSQQSFAEDTQNQALSIELWREIKEQRQPMTVSASRGLFGFSATALIAILLVAIPIFLAVPRVSRGAGRNSLLSTEALSGFSDTVRLGEVAQVKLNPQIVMRVRLRQQRGQQQMLRWRGVTLDQYDGQSWFQSGPEPSPIRSVGDSFRLDDKLLPRTYTEQRFFLEPIDTNVVFVAPRPIAVIGLPELSRDVGDGLWTEPHRYNKIDYTVYSDTSVPGDEELAADNTRDFRRSIRERYLQLPPEHDKRISQLAADIVQGAPTQIEMARRIERHLREQYTYSLNLNQVAEGDPVADFLFNTRAGHCEYFASAMVLMLRSRQIPARIVNGFQTGEYNAPADVYTVRQSDAHSWVEVLFPRSGWVAFDPTPAAGLSNYGDGLMAWMRQYGEAMEMFWLEHVVGFDLSRQLSMAYAAQKWIAFYQKGASSQWLDWTSGLARRLESWRETRAPGGNLPEDSSNKASWRSVALHPAMLAGAALAILGALVFFWRNRWRSWRCAIKRDAGQSAIRFYQEMLRLLERAGHKREPHQTPQEFAAQLAIPAVNEITRLYQRKRFGDEVLGDDEAARVESLLRDLKKQAGRQNYFRWPLRSVKRSP
ncbi:MAG TPA: DUF3488 and transglutaminase-like domain-containing protein [Blastocatellia bacterium]